MEHVDRLLSDCLDGELNHDAAIQVERHLAACAACTRRCRSLRRTVRFVQTHAAVQITPASPAASIARFNRALMHPASIDADVNRLLFEELQRHDGGAPGAKKGGSA